MDPIYPIPFGQPLPGNPLADLPSADSAQSVGGPLPLAATASGISLSSQRSSQVQSQITTVSVWRTAGVEELASSSQRSTSTLATATRRASSIDIEPLDGTSNSIGTLSSSHHPTSTSADSVNSSQPGASATISATPSPTAGETSLSGQLTSVLAQQLPQPSTSATKTTLSECCYRWTRPTFIAEHRRLSDPNLLGTGFFTTSSTLATVTHTAQHTLLSLGGKSGTALTGEYSSIILGMHMANLPEFLMLIFMRQGSFSGRSPVRSYCFSWCSCAAARSRGDVRNRVRRYRTEGFERI